MVSNMEDRIPFTRTVTAEVLGQEMHNNRPIIKIDVAEWRRYTKYPIPLYNPSGVALQDLKMGLKARIVLQFDKLKEGKDPSNPINYFHSYVRFADDAEPTATEPMQPPSPAVQGGTAPVKPATATVSATQGKATTITANGQSYADKERERTLSILRQVALKAAVQDTNVGVYDYPAMAAILTQATAYYQWLCGDVEAATETLDAAEKAFEKPEGGAAHVVSPPDVPTMAERLEAERLERAGKFYDQAQASLLVPSPYGEPEPGAMEYEIG